ncbi:hypothetical protein ACET3Z_006227 [Daucus carota]
MEEDARADIQQLIRRKKQTKLKLKSGVSNLIDAVIIPRQIRVEEFEIKGAKRRHVMLVAGAINAITGRKDWQEDISVNSRAKRIQEISIKEIDDQIMDTIWCGGDGKYHEVHPNPVTQYSIVILKISSSNHALSL